MNQDICDLPISHEVDGTYFLTHGLELFLVGSKIFLKSIKIPVKSSVETTLERQSTILDSSPSSTTIWLTLGRSIPLFGPQFPQMLNLGTETNNLCGPPSCNTL